jgi:ADP-heptose:LPS heptosyltransferase
LLSALNPRSLNPATARIVLLRLSSLGDCLHALPVFHRLRAALPQARLAWAVERRCADLLMGLPGLDELIVFERQNGLAGVWSCWRSLRRFRADWLLDLQGNGKSQLIAAGSGARWRWGAAAADRAEHWPRWSPRWRHAAPLKLETPGEPPHAVDRGLALLEAWLQALGLPAQTPPGPLRLDPGLSPGELAQGEAQLLAGLRSNQASRGALPGPKAAAGLAQVEPGPGSSTRTLSPTLAPSLPPTEPDPPGSLAPTSAPRPARDTGLPTATDGGSALHADPASEPLGGWIVQLAARPDPRALSRQTWLALLRRARDAKRPLLVSYGPAERDLLADLESELGPLPRLQTVLNVRQLAALFEAARRRGFRYLGCDRGPLHLAASVGLPAVLLHGPTAPGRTGPYPPPGRAGSPHRAMTSDLSLECRPCLARHCRRPGGPACLDGLDVERLWMQLEQGQWAAPTKPIL